LWWFLVLLGWASAELIGHGNRFNGNFPPINWGFVFIGLYVAGFVGARQSSRRSLLFTQNGRLRPGFSDWILFLFTPFVPLLFVFVIYYLMGVWDYL